MSSKQRLSIVFMSCGLLFVSCMTEPWREVLITDFPALTGGQVLTAEVVFENSDTLSLKNIRALVRFRNVPAHYDRFNFIIETLTPDSLTWRDTLSVLYRQEELTETTSLSYTDIKTDYRPNTRLLKAGIYRFRFGSLMPEADDTGVIGLGLEITTQ